MKSSSIVSLASIVAILIAGTAYLTFGVVRVNPFRETITATLTVPDSGGLITRSKVLLTGVEVGQVTDIDRTAAGIRVVFRVDADHPIPAASTVRIRSLSGLGEPYLEFVPDKGAGAPYLADGQEIASSKVTTPLSIAELARTVTQLLAQLEPEVLTDIVDTFSTALTGTDTVIPQLAHASELLAATLLSRTDVLRQLLIDLQANATELDWAGAALADASVPWSEFGPRISEVAASIAVIVRTGDAPADYLVDTPESVGLVPFLHQLTDRIDTIGPELSPLVPVLQPLVASATGTVQQIDLSSLISQALATTSADGTLHLQITVK